MSGALATVVALAAVAALIVRELVHRHEIARLKAQLEAARSASFKGDDLASVGAMVTALAQALKGPLQGVLGNTELMLLTDRSEQDTEELREIRQDATRAAGIVRNLLAFTDTSNLKRNWTDVNEIVTHAADIARAEIPGDRVDMVLALPARLPLLYVDGRQLENVLATFLGRAARELSDRADAGRATIRVVTGRTTQPDDQVFIDIDEEGALLPRLSESFGDDGLTACATIIEAHGGSLTIKDRPRGLHVHLEFPIRVETEPGVIREWTTSSISSTSTGSATSKS
jgi:two-component system, LuxR family, sensor histidine kinase DctS